MNGLIPSRSFRTAGFPCKTPFLETAAMPARSEGMIKLALICLVFAAVAAILGFGGLAGTMVDVAIVLAVIAAILFVVFLVLGIVAGRKVKDTLDGT